MPEHFARCLAMKQKNLKARIYHSLIQKNCTDTAVLYALSVFSTLVTIICYFCGFGRIGLLAGVSLCFWILSIFQMNRMKRRYNRRLYRYFVKRFKSSGHSSNEDDEMELIKGLEDTISPKVSHDMRMEE